MPTRDLYHSIAPVGFSLAPATVTTTTNGNAVDTFGYESVTFFATVAAIGGTTPSFAFKVQDSDDGSTNWQDLDPTCYMGGAGAPAALTANGGLLAGVKDCSAVAPVQAGQVRRFVRAVVTVTGTTPTASLASGFVLGHPHHRNVAV